MKKVKKSTRKNKTYKYMLINLKHFGVDVRKGYSCFVGYKGLEIEWSKENIRLAIKAFKALKDTYLANNLRYELANYRNPY